MIGIVGSSALLEPQPLAVNLQCGLGLLQAASKPFCKASGPAADMALRWDSCEGLLSRSNANSRDRSYRYLERWF